MGYGSQITLPFDGLSYPYGVAVDTAENVFVADTYNSRVVELPKTPTGYGPQITLPFSGPIDFVPIGIALDNAGGVFVTNDATNQALELQTRSVKFPGSQPVGNVPGIHLAFLYNVRTSVTFGTPKVLTVGGQPSPDFAVSEESTCTGKVEAGTQCTVTVNFLPSAEGVRTASVELTDGGGNVLATTPVSGIGVGAENTPPVAKVSANVLQFGTIPFGSSKDLALTISNVGGGTLTLFPSMNAQSFTIAESTCGIGLPSGQSCTLAVQFSPVTIATHLDTLTLDTNTSVNPAVALRGVATGISVSSPALQFGTIFYGSTAILPLTLTNHGVPGTVTITPDFTNNGRVSYDEARGGTCNEGIASGESCILPVEFNPDGIGQHNALLTLVPSGGAAATTIGLHGTASGLLSNPGSPNFGAILDGSSAVQTLTITDVDMPGTVNVTAAVTFGGSFYTILDTPQNTCGAPLTAGQSCVLPVQFSPSKKVGGIDGILSLTSSAGGKPRFVTLYGEGSRN
jgi:hypothetical protein